MQYSVAAVCGVCAYACVTTEITYMLARNYAQSLTGGTALVDCKTKRNELNAGFTKHTLLPYARF